MFNVSLALFWLGCQHSSRTSDPSLSNCSLLGIRLALTQWGFPLDLGLLRQLERYASEPHVPLSISSFPPSSSLCWKTHRLTSFVRSDPFNFSSVSSRAANLGGPELLFSSKSYLLSLNPLLSHHRHLYPTLPVPTPSAPSPAKGFFSFVQFCAPHIGWSQVARWHPGPNLCSWQSLLLSLYNLSWLSQILSVPQHHPCRMSWKSWLQGLQPRYLLCPVLSDLHGPDHNLCSIYLSSFSDYVECLK